MDMVRIMEAIPILLTVTMTRIMDTLQTHLIMDIPPMALRPAMLLLREKVSNLLNPLQVIRIIQMPQARTRSKLQVWVLMDTLWLTEPTNSRDQMLTDIFQRRAVPPHHSLLIILVRPNLQPVLINLPTILTDNLLRVSTSPATRIINRMSS